MPKKSEKKPKTEVFNIDKPPLFPTAITLTPTSADDLSILTFLYGPQERLEQEYVLARLALTPKQKAFLSKALAPDKKKPKKKTKTKKS